MGERGNIVITQDNSLNVSEVVFYTHWKGYMMKEIVAEALNSTRGRNRWSDHRYLARIIFDCLIYGEEHTEKGYGISTERCSDENYPPVIVNMVNQTVNGIPYEEFIGRYIRNVTEFLTRNSLDDILKTTKKK